MMSTRIFKQSKVPLDDQTSRKSTPYDEFIFGKMGDEIIRYTSLRIQIGMKMKFGRSWMGMHLPVDKSPCKPSRLVSVDGSMCQP